MLFKIEQSGESGLLEEVTSDEKPTNTVEGAMQKCQILKRTGITSITPLKNSSQIHVEHGSYCFKLNSSSDISFKDN